MTARLTLSQSPPSVNAMYNPVGKGRNILSKDARIWKKKALRELGEQMGIGPEPMFWRYDALIPGAGAKIDLPNYEKALTDIMVEAQKVPDDRYLVDYRIRFWSGTIVVVAIQLEGLSKWAKIKQISNSLTKKLAKRFL